MFVLGLLLWFALGLAAGFRMVHAYNDYLTRYRAQGGPALAEPDSGAPPSWMLATGPKLAARGWELLWQRQAVREVEQARRGAQRWWWLTAAVVFLGFPIPIVFSLVGAR